MINRKETKTETLHETAPEQWRTRGTGVNRVRTSYRELPERKTPSNLETHNSYSFRKSTSHNLHRETHLGLARSPKKNRTGSTRRDLQPAMPSYGEGRLKITASNLPTCDRIHPFNRALKRTIRHEESLPSGEAPPSEQESQKIQWSLSYTTDPKRKH